MNEQRFRIFVVDDDPIAQMITVDQLDDPLYEVIPFDNGEDALIALDQAPDLILMDVEMPGRNGIEICRSIRETGNDHAQVIFISSHDDIDTRLAAYDSGGNDFIVKPFAPEELAQKVRLAERFLGQHRGLAQQAQFAQKTAFTVMSSLGEMGVVLQFMRTSFACSTPEQLLQALFEALGQYGLRGLVGLRDESGEHCHASHGDCTPLETSIVGHAAGMDRIFQFRDRLAINYPRITLLVPNLPVEDPDLIGRLRDHLAIIAEGAEARLHAMASEQQRLAQASGIMRAVSDLTRVLTEIEAGQTQHRMRALEVANTYLHDLDRAFVHMGLAGSQEESLVAMAKGVAENYSQLQADSKSLGDKLRQVVEELQGMRPGEA